MRSAIARACMYAMGLSLLVYSAGSHLLAGVTTTPEIDGGSISAGLGLLTAAVLILRARRRSK
jgi:uncharacterized protein (TIGR03382 family)